MEKLRVNKKGVAAVNFLTLSIVGLVVAIIMLTVGINVNDTVTDNIDVGDCGTNTSHVFLEPPTCDVGTTGEIYNFTCHCAAYNASALGTTGLGTFANYWAVIVIVVILAVIIALFGIFGAGGYGGIAIR